MAMPYLAVKDFAKHQHYRDRRPPWIKLYASVLTDAAFLQMPEAAQAQLMKLWILASQFGNPLPNNPKLLAGKIGCTGKFHLDTLIASGFLIPTEQSASEPLAEVENVASPSVRVARETEDRGQRESSESSSSASAARLRLLELLGNTDAARQEVDTFLAGLPDDAKRHGWARNLVMSIEDGNGHPIAPAVMLLALADFNLADRQQFPYNGALFRAFVDRAAKPRLDTAPRKSSPDDDAQIAVTAIRAMIETQGQSRFIKRERVEALGAPVLAAYLALGGADRFLSTQPDKLPFLVRDFAQALRTHAA